MDGKFLKIAFRKRLGNLLFFFSLQKNEVRCRKSQLWSQVRLAILWRVNIGRCVDASPLVVRVTGARLFQSEKEGLPDQPGISPLPRGEERAHSGLSEDFPPTETRESVSAVNFAPEVESGVTTVVYIGSHSHWFMAVEFVTGQVLWKSMLEDRVESSACSSLCGHYVVVGEGLV